MSRTSPFVLSATVDFPDDVGYGTYTPELLDRMMVQLKELGVTRVYWLYYGDVNQDSYGAGKMIENARGPYGTPPLAPPL